MTNSAIQVAGLSKTYDGAEPALSDVSIEVAEGEILSLLGHNGAGKTTLVNILSTLLPPSSGSASVAGFDVVRESRSVRSRIGLTGQFASVELKLSGMDNLVLIGRLMGASRKQAAERAVELLEAFGLTHAARQQARSYSGGMRRRLDLALSLVGRPQVVFLDEPSTGLDPASRLALWDTVEKLVASGTSVLLTTQYLEEAERLAHRVAVLSRGRVVTSGTAAQLKARLGVRTAQLRVRDAADLPLVTAALRAAGLSATEDLPEVTVSTPVDSYGDLAQVVRAVESVETSVAEVSLSEPSLNDVYLALAQDQVPSA